MKYTKRSSIGGGFSLQRVISEYLPMGIGAGLTAFLFWSFIISPYATSSQDLAESEEAQVGAAAGKGAEAGRHPLSVKSAGNSYSHKTDFMPERTDLEFLLNKSLSIDPLLNNSFSLGPRVSDWDAQRANWLSMNSNEDSSSSSDKPKVFLLTGSQPSPCQNLMGDHMLVRSIKNKIDYCRRHDIELFYNMAKFTDDLPSWWVKLPLIRSFMLAHPEVEWFWWMDSDAVFTDMSFEIPFERYKDYNFVLHGWDRLIYEERKWTGLNMGIFLVRNCQWTLDLFDEMAPMGFRGEIGDKVGKILTMSLSGRPENFESDDQGAFIYLLNADKEQWGSKVYLENSYFLNGYWKDLVDRYEEWMKTSRPGFGDERWPFVTHFTGCQICSGKINSVYTPEECTKQMDRALTFGDNQALESLGYAHPGLSTPDIVRTNKKEKDSD